MVDAAIVLDAELAFVHSINGVPDVTKVVAPVNIVPVPAHSILFVPNARVPENPVIVRVEHIAVPAPIVTVPVERLVKKTSSAEVGTASPPAPPEVKAHLDPAVPSHVAVPPTQYLDAISQPVVD
jgi:hypothetical protein